MSGPRPAAGWMPWTFWGLGALFYCYGFFQRVAPSVMVTDLMRDFAVSGAVLGNLSAFYFYAYAGLQLPVGVLVDRFGPRRILAMAAMLCGAGSLMFAMADGISMAYLGRLLIGAGAAFTWVGTLKLASDWFEPRRFAMVTGLTLALGMAGAIGGQAPLAALVEVQGWRASLAGAAAFGAVLGVTIWLVVRDRGSARPGGGGRGILAGLAATVRTPQNWLTALFGCAMTAPMLAFAALWGVPFMMQAYGLERPAAAASTSLVLAGWAIGAPVAGALSDRIGRRKLPMLSGGIAAYLAFAVLIYVPDLPLAAAQALLFVNGLVSGVMVIAFAAAREHNAPENAGAALGFVNMAVMAAGAIFQPLIGWVLDLSWSGGVAAGSRVYAVADYRLAFLTLIGIGVVGMAAEVFARETWCRNIHEDLR